MRLNTVFWVTFVVLMLCVSFFRLSSDVSKGIYTFEYTSMYPVDTRARGTGTT